MELRDWLTLIALLLGFWNLYRLRKFQDRIEYKDTRKLYRNCLSETKDLIEKITIETASLMQRRIDFDLLDSKYIGSHGYQQADQSFMKHYNSMIQQKKKAETVYLGLGKSLSASDELAFDTLIESHKLQKDVYIEFINSFSKAKAQIDGIENMANYLKDRA